MFCAVGAKALTEDSVLIGFIERSHKAEKEKRAKLIKARESRRSDEAEARVILAKEKPDAQLVGAELDVLLRWKLGPKWGASKVKNVADKRAKWVEVKAEPEPIVEPAEDLPPLPHEGVLRRLRARAAATPRAPPHTPTPAVLAPPIAPTPVPETRTVDVARMSIGELDGLVALAEAAEAERRRREAAQQAAEAAAAAGEADPEARS